MGISASHLIVVALVALVLFGRGKISELMGDVGKGIRGFREGLKEDDAAVCYLPKADDATRPERPKNSQ